MIALLTGRVAFKAPTHLILDVHGLTIADPVALETTIDGIVGVVTNGLFAKRGADVLLLATPEGVQTFERT